MLKLVCKTYEELSKEELYKILALRQEVFIVEQNCIFQDIDFKDQKALHCIGTDESGELMAYTRLFDKDIYYQNHTSIGRVVGSPKGRGKGFGQEMMVFSIEQCHKNFGKIPIQIGAQSYLQKFYESFGFKSINQDYIEDGIEHMLMVLK